MRIQNNSSNPGSPDIGYKYLPIPWIILGIPILLAFLSTAIQGWGYVFDDSFITYRYAKNLAMGYGITWNPGLPPTEGYTNFLLVIVLAPVIKFGFDPLLATRLLSYTCAIAMAGILFAVARYRYHCSATIATMIAALILLVPETKNLSFVGLETMIYAFFLLVTFIVGVAFMDSRRTTHSIIFSVLLFLTMLLRPEAALLYPVVFVAFVATAVQRNWNALKPLLFGLLVLLIVGSVYLTWKYFHFGQILPNPFYIKVSGQELISPEGIKSLRTFVGNNALLLALVLPSLVLSFFFARPGQPRNKAAALTGFAFLLVYCSFFAHTDTLMDLYGRFLYPLVPIIILLATPVLATALGYFESVNRHKFLVLTSITVAFLLAFGSSNLLGIYENVSRLTPNDKSQTSESLMQKEYRISRVLARFPQITEVRVAFNDSGVIPYFSGPIWLDTVGLNDGYIATTRDKGKVVDYFFNWSPDLVIHPGKADQSWFRYGHGTLGDSQSWANDPRWDDYEYVGTSRTSDTLYDLQYFVRKSSRFRISLESFLKEYIVDGWYEPFPLPIGTYKPNMEIRPMWYPRAAPHS